MFTVGFIGFGKIAKAIYYGIEKNFPNQNTYIYDVNRNQIPNSASINVCSKISDLCQVADIIFVCVKPNIVPDICDEIQIKNKAFISVAAGITQEYLESKLPSDSRIARIMPNTPLLIGQGMVCIQTPNTLNRAEAEFISELFNKLGEVAYLKGDQMDIATGISGSGPAYIFFLIDALTKAGTLNGLTKEDSLQLTLQTFIGACKMVKETQETPEQLISDVCSPNGTTVAAMNVFYESNINEIINNAVSAATKRAKELSQ